MDSVKLREILVEVAQGGAKVLADPEVFECAVNSGHEDIMSALKRGAGVVVKELEWRNGKTRDAYNAHAIGSMIYAAFHAHDDRDWCAMIRLINDDQQMEDIELASGLSTPEAAKAACQADYAKRITSAVEPTGGLADGLEQAAALIDAEVGAYIKDHGMYDSTTGHMEYPGNGEEWVADREELAEAIRALKGTAPASSVGPTETPDQLSQAGEGQPEATQSALVSGMVSDDLRELLGNCIAVLNEFGSSEIPDWDEAPDTAVTIRPAAQRKGLRELRDLTLGVGDFIAAKHYAEALTAALSTSQSEEEAELARLREALTPSCDTKAAYMGEFSFLIDDYDEDGEEHSRKVTVPWDTVKEIMAFIRARSLTNGGE